MRNASEVLIESLIAAGVKRVYGIAGDSLNGVTEAIRKSGQIEWVHVRHEEVAAFAAETPPQYGPNPGFRAQHGKIRPERSWKRNRRFCQDGAVPLNEDKVTPKPRSRGGLLGLPCKRRGASPL